MFSTVLYKSASDISWLLISGLIWVCKMLWILIQSDIDVSCNENGPLSIISCD